MRLAATIPHYDGVTPFEKFVAAELKKQPNRSLLICASAEQIDDLWTLCDGDSFDYFLEEQVGEDGRFYYYGMYSGWREFVMKSVTESFDVDVTVRSSDG